jgi:hypothetical protein
MKLLGFILFFILVAGAAFLYLTRERRAGIARSGAPCEAYGRELPDGTRLFGYDDRIKQLLRGCW